MNEIQRAIEYIDLQKEKKPRLFKAIYYLLWCVAPLEMAGIYFSKKAYDKLKRRNQ